MTIGTTATMLDLLVFQVAFNELSKMEDPIQNEEDEMAAYHELMYRQNREQIEVKYLNGSQKGLSRPTVLVYDLRATWVQEFLLRYGMSEEKIEGQVLKADQREVEPIVLSCVTASEAAGYLKVQWPEVAAVMQRLPRESEFFFVCVSRFGAGEVARFRSLANEALTIE